MSLIRILVLSLVTPTLGFSKAQAVDVQAELAAAQAAIKANSPMDTEQKAANVLVAYSRLMGALADLVSDMSGAKGTLKEIRELLPTVTEPAYAHLVSHLKSQIVVLVESVNGNNKGIQNLAVQVKAFEKAKTKWPQAKFVVMLDQLVKLTEEMATNFQNFASQLDRCALHIENIAAMIYSQSPQLSQEVEALSDATLRAEKYSFEGIGERFRSIGSVINQLYNE